LKIEDRVRGISLKTKDILRRQLDDSSPKACARQEGGGIELEFFKLAIDGPPLGSEP
jgi:hypothetical protein